MHERGMYERGGQEQGAVAQAVHDRRAGERRRRVLRRRASGPRPVRPAVNAVAVRPAETERPQVPSGDRRVSPSVSPPVPLPVPLRDPGLRTLTRRPRAVPHREMWLARLRRALAGLVVTVAAAAVVVGLGVLADSAAAVRAAEESVAAPPGTVVVTVRDERSPWEVARRLAPGAQGAELASFAERIVTENSLGSGPLRPGQVLRVTSG